MDYKLESAAYQLGIDTIIEHNYNVQLDCSVKELIDQLSKLPQDIIVSLNYNSPGAMD